MAGPDSGYPAVFAGATNLNLVQHTLAELVPGNQIFESRPAGALDPDANMLAAANSRCTFATGDLDSLLAKVNIASGFDCSSGATIQFQQRQNRGGFQTGSNHDKAASTSGFLWIDSITATHGRPAVARIMYQSLWGGALGTPPFVYSTGQSLAQSPAHVSTYWLAPIELNSGAYPDVIQTTISNRIVVEPFFEGGALWPKKCAITSRGTIVSIDLLDASRLATSGLYGLAMAGALDVYLWKGKDGEQRETTASLNHVRFSIATGGEYTDSIRAQGISSAVTRISFRATAAATQATGVALP